MKALNDNNEDLSKEEPTMANFLGELFSCHNGFLNKCKTGREMESTQALRLGATCQADPTVPLPTGKTLQSLDLSTTTTKRTTTTSTSTSASAKSTRAAVYRTTSTSSTKTTTQKVTTVSTTTTTTTRPVQTKPLLTRQWGAFTTASKTTRPTTSTRPGKPDFN